MVLRLGSNFVTCQAFVVRTPYQQRLPFGYRDHSGVMDPNSMGPVSDDPVISDVRIEPVDSSPFIKLKRAHFTTADGSTFQADLPQMHDR